MLFFSGASQIVSHFSRFHKNEQISILTFGSECRFLIEFTSDFDKIQSELKNLPVSISLDFHEFLLCCVAVPAGAGR